MATSKVSAPHEAVLPRMILFSLAMAVLLLLAALLAFLIRLSWPVVLADPSKIFSLYWNTEQGSYGVFPMVAGSGALASIALIIGFPLALGVSGYCSLKEGHVQVRCIRAMIRLMAGIPTVVYGIAALFILLPLLRQVLHAGSGYCLIAAAGILAILTLPVMVMISDNHLHQQMKQYRLTAASLGFSQAQALVYFAFPGSIRGLATALLLGFNRAIGDTMIPLMLAGNAAQLPGSWFDSVRALTAHIALVIATENGSDAYNSLFAAALILLAISVSVTLSTRAIERAYLKRQTSIQL